ncbi:unnamed protein product [Ceutorhynchus assimilis]|uniref:Uncharacterized protein n=1 Tax=Ceutorhynchus assimilis TaxID=467358 RepID=A0A9N9QQW3_9CUCU|nr:unnamed protein product [Ceutorhynchus assimilis]
MWYFIVLAVVHSVCVQANNLLQECAKYYRPKNYLDMLPNLNMPYINQLPIPDSINKFRHRDHLNKMQNIVATPVTTKVLTVKTKYFYKNPICVKYNKKQKMCKSEDGRIRENVDKLITKQNFLKNNDNIQQEVISEFDVISEEDDFDADKFNLKVSFGNLEPSEIPESDQSQRAFQNTPSMSPQKVQELLIEDRLDQLETILPNYQRRRVFQTSTIYVTKTVTNKRRMATLIVKNCVPIGYDVCPKKEKSKRKSKVAERSEDSEEKLFYFG